MQFINIIMVSALGLLASISPSMGVSIAPQEAYYTMDLIKNVNNPNNVSDIRGMVLINHKKTCEGWITIENLKMSIKFGNGASKLQNLQFSRWESLDGKMFLFAVKENTPFEELSVRGAAKLTSKGGEVKFTTPQKPDIKLPLNTKFPMAFLSNILKKVMAGKKSIGQYFFHGSDLSGPEWLKVSVLGRSENKFSTDLKDEPLLEGAGWRLRLTAFTNRNTAFDSLYSYEAVVLENGILVSAFLNFEGFKVHQKLKMFTAFENPKC